MPPSETHPLCYTLVRVLDDEGKAVGPWDPRLDPDTLRRMLKDMLLVRVFDERMFRAQRQGKTSFYMKSLGEEAVAVAAAHALDREDMCFPTYRQQGLLIARAALRALDEGLLRGIRGVVVGEPTDLRVGIAEKGVLLLMSDSTRAESATAGIRGMMSCWPTDTLDVVRRLLAAARSIRLTLSLRPTPATSPRSCPTFAGSMSTAPTILKPLRSATWRTTAAPMGPRPKWITLMGPVVDGIE